MNLIKKVENDRVDKAVKTIKGYCAKHFGCTANCRFFDKKERECIFEKGIIPVDWSETDATQQPDTE